MRKSLGYTILDKQSLKDQIVLFVGGVGGAKIAEGLAQLIPNEQLTIYVNSGDDFNHFGLVISPDLDTVMYMLAGLSNPESGWGRKNETWHALETIKRLDGPDWFHLGDYDLGHHLERTRLIKNGVLLSKITRIFATKYGVKCTILPMTDDPVRTMIHTKKFGTISFQEYFVKYACQPEITGIHFSGIKKAKAVDGMLETLSSAKYVIFGPSNPFVSIAPILALKGVRSILKKKVVVAISPIIAGKAVKGPVCKMLAELGYEANSLEVAKYYDGLLTGFIIDNADSDYADELTHIGIVPFVTKTLMVDKRSRKSLAKETLKFCESLYSAKCQ